MANRIRQGGSRSKFKLMHYPRGKLVASRTGESVRFAPRGSPGIPVKNKNSEDWPCPTLQPYKRLTRHSGGATCRQFWKNLQAMCYGRRKGRLGNQLKLRIVFVNWDAQFEAGL